MSNSIAVASFGLLSTTEQNPRIKGFFDRCHQTKSDSPRLQLIATEFKTKRICSATLPFYAASLLKSNPHCFRYLNDAQRTALEQDLLLAFYYFGQRFQTNVNERRNKPLVNCFSDLLQCEQLIEALRLSKLSAKNSPADHQKTGEAILAELQSRSIGKTVRTRDLMRDFNGWRLYWVWAGNLLRTVLGLLPDTFFNKTQAEQAVTIPQPVLGVISWALYYARFLLHLGLLLKHTISGTWMSPEEQDIGWKTRLNAQWQERKFILLNDILWATTNLATYFWLIGNGFMGYMGNVVTVGLLLCDLLLTVWRRIETLEAYKMTADGFQSEIQLLQQKIDDQNRADTEALALLKTQQARLIRALQMHEFERQHQKRSINAEVAYAAALMAAFALMCSCLIPNGVLGTTSSTVLSVTGGGLCFIFAFINTVYRGYIDVTKTQDKRYLILLEHQALLSKQGELTQLDLIQIQERELENTYLLQLERYHRLNWIRSTLIESIIPLAVFSTFTFFSVVIAATLLIIGVIAAISSHYKIEKQKPKEIDWSNTPQPQLTNDALKQYNGQRNERLNQVKREITKSAPPKSSLMRWLCHAPNLTDNTTLVPIHTECGA